MIVIGSDHAGFEYKAKIIEYLKGNGFEYKDVGTFAKESCDYPVIAKEVANYVASGEAEKGILICGTGIGVSIAANRVKGIYAALCSETTSARMSRQHNNSNVLCLGQRVIGENLALDIVDTWLNTEFLGGRHQRRVEMID